VEFFDTIMYATPSSKKLEDNDKYRVVCCLDGKHESLTFYGTSHEDAKESAELLMKSHRGFTVVEVWDHADEEFKEAGAVFDIGWHDDCEDAK
jgi:hypothetical protein